MQTFALPWATSTEKQLSLQIGKNGLNVAQKLLVCSLR